MTDMTGSFRAKPGDAEGNITVREGIAVMRLTLAGAVPRTSTSPRPAIRQRLAELLNVEPEAVGVKAQTFEGLNLDNTAMVHVVVLLGRR